MKIRNRVITLALTGIMIFGAAFATNADEATRAKGVVFTKESGYVASTYTGTLNGAVCGTTTAGNLVDALENKLGIEVKRGDAVLGNSEVLKYGDKVVLTADDGTVKSSFEVKFMGDANSDSKVNLSDASKMLQKIAKWDATIDEMISDVDGNGTVNLSDVARLLQVLAKWDVDFEKNPVLPGKYTMVNKGDIGCYGNPGAQGWVPLCLSDGIHYDLGVKFNVKADEFATQIGFLMPSWADSKGKITVSIYKWDGDYNSSISAMPIISHTFVDYPDNSTQVMDLLDASGKGLVEGEYVWRMHDGVDAGEGTGVGIWYFEKLQPAESTGIKTFLNCKEFNIGPVANIFFAKAK